MSRSQRPFYYLILGVLSMVLLFFGVVVGLWVNQNYQAMEDARRLQAAGFRITSSEREAGLNNWLVNLENNLFPAQPPRHWTSLANDEQTDATADEIVTILARQRSLEIVQLPSSCVNERVLNEIVKRRKLTSVIVHADQTLDEAWLKKLRPDQGWKVCELDVPGLSPAGATKILQSCPDVVQLGLPDDAIDDAVCDAILAQSTLRMQIYFDQDGTHSPAAIRLAETFSGQAISCFGRKLPDGVQPAQPLIIKQSGNARLIIDRFARAEVQATTGQSFVSYSDQVLVKNAVDRVLVRGGKDFSLLDSPQVHSAQLSMVISADIAHCSGLKSIFHRGGTLKLDDLPALRRYLSEGPSPSVIPQLAKCPSLVSAQFRLFPLQGGESLTPLATLPNLKTLVLGNEAKSFTHPWFAELEHLPHLKNFILLQEHHPNNIPGLDWSTFQPRFPPSLERMIFVCLGGPEIVSTPGWKEMIARYADTKIQFEALHGTSWQVPEECLPLVE